MSKNKPYYEKLRDPRWQKKRLKILERDDFTCFMCGDTESTLHVHHKKYSPTGNPWDADNEDLVTLCEGCHEAEHFTLEVISKKGKPVISDDGKFLLSKVVMHGLLTNKYSLLDEFVSSIINLRLVHKKKVTDLLVISEMKKIIDKYEQ